MNKFIYCPSAHQPDYYINSYQVQRIYADGTDEHSLFVVTVEYINGEVESFSFVDEAHAKEFIEQVTGNYN